MSETKSFWTTLPGILTGIAGIITAIGGLLVVLYQIEVIGPNRISGEIESERQSSEKPVRSKPEPMPEPEPEPEQQTKPYSTEGSYITARNRSEYIGNNRWNWTIFIDAPPEVLSKIDCVQYTLHPTFGLPPQKVCTESNRFAFSTTGWGTFEVPILVIFKDGTEKPLKHELEFR